jgi:hypothetical protein
VQAINETQNPPTPAVVSIVPAHSEYYLARLMPNFQPDMEAESTPLDLENQANPFCTLSELDWRVWFLGYGLGGCFGICVCVGIWSVLVDDNQFPGWIAVAISLAHACLLALFWKRRSTTRLKTATAICYLAGALGIASVALLVTSGSSRVPGVGSLFTLALMNAIFAFTAPLMVQTRRGRSKP